MLDLGLSDGSEYQYDENGNMTCRVEDEQTFIQSYNAENRISEVQAVTGICDTPGDTTATWTFTYDGDGVKVMQVYDDGTTTLTTRYYMGGAYEITTDGTNETVKKYYSLAGITVAMYDGTQMLYFLTDHLGSLVFYAGRLSFGVIWCNCLGNSGKHGRYGLFYASFEYSMYCKTL